MGLITMTESNNPPKFTSRVTRELNGNYSRGFEITFENGLAISVQYGLGCSCSNRNSLQPSRDGNGSIVVSSRTADIAVFDLNDKCINQEIFGQNDMGWITADEIPEIMQKVASWKPKE